MQKNYFMYNILANIQTFMKVCDICQKAKIKSLKTRPFHARIPIDYSENESLSVDTKYIPKGFDYYKFLILVNVKLPTLFWPYQSKYEQHKL